MSLKEDMFAICSSNEFMKHNHIALKTVEPDHAIVDLTLGPDALNPYGIAHGGILYTMGDCAAGVAARCDGRHYVTLSSSMNFLKSGKPGDYVQAESHVSHRGRSTCCIDVEIRTADALLAKGSFEFFALER